MAVELRQRDEHVLEITYVGEITDDDIREVIAKVLEINAKGIPFATLVDTRKAAHAPNAKQRRLFTDSFERIKANPPCAVTCVSMVTDSAIMRSVLTALAWVSPPPFPMKAFATVQEAELWARSRVAQMIGSATGRPL